MEELVDVVIMNVHKKIVPFFCGGELWRLTLLRETASNKSKGVPKAVTFETPSFY
jgi:hypothetical protein